MNPGGSLQIITYSGSFPSGIPFRIPFGQERPGFFFFFTAPFPNGQSLTLDLVGMSSPNLEQL